MRLIENAPLAASLSAALASAEKALEKINVVVSRH
jgi:hypothetical protein